METQQTGPSRERELTWLAILLGIILSLVMGAANVYLGLKVGMTVSASIPAAVVAMGVLRALRGRSGVLESNLVQTAASAGESLAAGIVFTMPALVIVGVWDSLAGWDRFFIVTAVALGGGLLGVLLMIPMRRVFVVDSRELLFPEGVACAEVLRAGATAGRDALFVLGGVLAGGCIKFFASSLHLIYETVEWARAVSGRVFYAGTDVSPALMAVGYIVGLRIALLIVLGGAIGWCVAIPMLGGFSGDATPEAAVAHARHLWSTKVRYIGVGAMVVGGLISIFRVRHGLRAAVAELFGRSSGEQRSDCGETRGDDLENSILIPTAVVTTLAIALLYFYLTNSVAITVVTAVSMLVLAFFLTAIASYIVGLVGNSNSPVSGMTLMALLGTALLLSLSGFAGEVAIVATLGVAGVVCCVACTAGDVCNDLKTGHLVGARPRDQQLLQVIGVVVAAFVMWPVLYMLHEGDQGGGFGGEELRAPQAQLFASLVDVFFGDGELQSAMFQIGVALAAFLFCADLVLQRLRPQSLFRFHVMPIAVGIYLPLSISVPILIGGIAHTLAVRPAPQRKKSGGVGVLLASGVIAGEALVGILIAAIRFLDRDAGEVAVSWSPQLVALVTFAVLALVPAAFFYFDRRTRPRN